MKGFYGKLLRVDLAKQEFTSESIQEDIFRKYLGGKGLASYLLLKNIKPGIDPLAEDNKIIITTGLAAGTKMFGSSRYGIFTKSPLTGLYAESYSGGSAAPAIHATGYDAIILEGASPNPVFLEISDEGVVFHEAGYLWGKDTYQTEDLILQQINKKGAEAIVIGPAGENLVAFACVENNYWRSAGRTGVGAVMGSKKVKGIVFYGKARTDTADPELLKELLQEILDKAKENPGVKAYQKYGTTQMVAVMNGAKAFPTAYWTDGQFNRWEQISGDSLHQNFEVKASTCPKCFLTCGNTTTVKEGKYAGLKLEGPEYETIYSFGGLCCIDRLDEIIHLNDICDRLGMDTISAGNLVGLVMEAVKRGLLEADLPYGNPDKAADLLHDIAYQRGLGAILAQGIRHASAKLGLQNLAVHVKGLEPAGYDPRRLKGMGLAYATSTRGACHLRATFYKPELAGFIDRKATVGKAAMFIDYENRLTIFHTGIICVFYRDLLLWPNLQKLIKAVTGWDYSEKELQDTANRIISATREFNAREGAGIKADTLPERLFEESINGGEDCITREELEYMVKDYYNLRGWNEAGYSLNS